MKIEPAPDVAPTFNQPQPDWVPIERALFYFSGNTFSTSEEECADSLFALLEDLTSDDWPRKAWPPDDRPVVLREGNSVGFRTKEASTWISPFNGLVHMFEDHSTSDQTRADWSFSVYGSRGLEQHLIEVKKKKKMSPRDTAVLKHRPVIFDVYHQWQTNFSTALMFGTARIMARPSVLAPFQAIAWDQWRHFNLRPQQYEWQEHEMMRMPDKAVAQTGETLFSVYVAPGARLSQGGESEEAGKCQRWLVESMREFPDRPPKPIPQLREEAIAKFPGLTERGFDIRYKFAQAESGNSNWSRPGRPKKPPQKSPQNK